ncbi:MAG: large-conductance mechanosensitive channel protein MscL [Oscillospiraceae bacterium]|nr:large-conductance mechanosensitive channel protein MscL [Oscillospiraceae bacterium]
MGGEFKEFISRGNVTDMAVGIIVGTSFTAIVNSMVADIITPLLGLLIGGIDFTELSLTIDSPIFEDFSITLAYGNFIQSIVRFTIIAVCVFFLVKLLNTFRRLATLRQNSDSGDEAEEEPPKPDEQIVLLTEIRDLLSNQLSTVNCQLSTDDVASGEELDTAVD